MNTSRKTARIVGVLFIAATVTSSLGYNVILSPILDAPDYLTNVAANKIQVIVGVLIDAIDFAAVVAIPVMLFPILKKHNEASALGYLSSRIIESVIFIVGHISILALVTLSQEYVQAAAGAAASFQAAGTLLLAVDDWSWFVGVGFAFPLTALILNWILFQSRLIPRWLSAWGLIGAAVWFASQLLQILGIDLPLIVAIPIGLQEMVFAVWLIVKGFNSSAIDTLKSTVGV
jgi:hypothetical protein